ncbi:MAG: tail fiber domain-containing protein [Candidatus Peribacteraceae bacterium]|nr:tail fiber domain-containing protein [Candidatus Peribacteraceae bacterium]
MRISFRQHRQWREAISDSTSPRLRGTSLRSRSAQPSLQLRSAGKATRDKSAISMMLSARLIMVCIIFVCLFVTAKASAATGIYRPINYQGKITNSGGIAVQNGRYNMRFRIFSTLTGGNPLWTETWDDSTTQVTLTGGLFSIALGTQTAMTGSVNFNTDSLYLQVEYDPVNDDTYPEIFHPRRRFGSVPFAHNANMLDGLDATQFLRSDADATASGTLTVRPRDASKIGLDLLSNAGIPALAALKISTQGANHIIFGSGGTNYDTNLYRSSAGVLRTDGSFVAGGTLSGRNLVVSGNAGLSGSLVVLNTITARGTYSGSVVHAEKSLSSSGSLVWEGSASGASLWASNISGAGLTNCDPTTGKLIWNNGRFQCGTDGGGEGSGLSYDAAAGIFVKKSGDTMTGALTINLTSGYLGLRVLQMMSGAVIHAEKSLTSSGLIMVTQRTAQGSGALVVNQAAGSTGAYIRGGGTTGGNSPLLVLDSSSIEPAKNPHILFGYNGTFDASLFRSSARTLTSSGNLVVSNSFAFKMRPATGANNYICYTATGALGTCSSSIRYKENVQDLGLGLETIRRMRPVTFRYKSDGTVDLGFVAEEVAAVNPLMAFYENGIVEGVKYSQITAVLTNAVQALDVRTLGITNDSGTVLHARDLLSSSGGLVINGFGTFGSGILLDTTYTNGDANVLEIRSAVHGTGTTVFRVNASGSVYTAGTFNARGADYAEWFTYSGQQEIFLAPGEAVCLDTTASNAVRRCERSGDNNIIGIVSTNPAFIGNVVDGAHEDPTVRHVLVGLIGQVPAKAMIEAEEGGADGTGVIRPGDALAAASVAGYVRKAKAGESTVGVALEPLAAGQGVINILISRRNQSFTVEAVEQKVADSIASMNIQDRIESGMRESLAAFDLTPTVRSELDAQITALNLAALVDESVRRHLSGALIAVPQVPEVTDALVDELRARLKIGTGTVIVDPALTAAIAALRADVEVLRQTLTGSDLHGETATVGDLTVQRSLTISGAVILSTGSTFRIGSGFEMGSLQFSGTGVTIGSLTASGALRVVGPITIEGFATFLGDVRIAGQLILSNRQAGFAVIPETGSSVTVRFDLPMIATPIVTATPDVPTLFGVSKVTATGFVIRIAAPATEKITFSFIALAADAPRTTMGTGAFLLAGGLMPFPVNAKHQPFSMTDPVWTACVQGRQTLDSLGIPLNCNRYHDGPVWEHPDLLVSFTWNPNHDPPLFSLPEGYQAVVVDDGLGDGQTETQSEVTHAAALETGTGSETGSGTTLDPSTGSGMILDPSTGSGETLPPETGSGDTAPPDMSPYQDDPPADDTTTDPSIQEEVTPDPVPAAEDPATPVVPPVEEPVSEPPPSEVEIPDALPVEAPSAEEEVVVVPVGNQLPAPAPLPAP